MSVVSVSYYRLLTGDESTAASALQDHLDDAESELEDYLGRTFTYGVHTERLKLWPSRVVYPAAIPIESVPVSANGELYDDNIIMNCDVDNTPYMDWPDIYEPGPVAGKRGSDYEAKYWYATVTYVGGWTENTMPVKLKKAVVRLAKAFKEEYSPSARQPGTTSARVGDVQVSWDKDQLGSSIDQLVPGLSRRIQGYKLDRR